MDFGMKDLSGYGLYNIALIKKNLKNYKKILAITFQYGIMLFNK